MRASISATAAAVLLALPLTAMASTLNDWTPRLFNLSAECEAVYTADLSGCTQSDFAPKGAVCNPACVTGLQEIAAQVKTACADEDFGDDTEAENILLCFRSGDGPQRVCPNNAVAQSSATSSTSMSAAQTTMSSSASSARAISSSANSTTSSTESSTTETITSTSSASSTTTTLELDTSTVTYPTSTPSQTGDSQGDSSGGGSPFDGASSSGVALAIPIAMTLLAAAIFIALI